MNAKRLKEQIGKANWEPNFYEFCQLIGCRQDRYGVELWGALQELHRSISRFDTETLQIILDYKGE